MSRVQARATPGAANWNVRRFVSDTLLVVATLLAVTAMIALWANRQLLSPDNWAQTSTELLDNATVRSATANYLAEQLFDNLDVARLLGSDLPGPLEGLAAPAEGDLRHATSHVIKLALARPEVRPLWSDANRAAAQALVAIVDGGNHTVAVNHGKVTLELRAILDEAGSRLGLSANLGNTLPGSVAELTILRSDQLTVIQSAGRALQGLATVLSILVPLLYLLAIVVARGRRRRVLLATGVSLVVAGIVAVVARRIAITGIADSLVTDASARPAVQDVVSIATSMLKEIAEVAIVVGAVLAIAAWVLGTIVPGARRST